MPPATPPATPDATPAATPPKAPKAPGAPVKPGSQGFMSLVDAMKLNPQDIGVSFGKAMTAEEFAEYRKSRPGVRVLKK